MSVLRFPLNGARRELDAKGRARRTAAVLPPGSEGSEEPRPAEIPETLARIDRLVAHAAAVIQPLAALTPLDVRRERDRLSRELRTQGRIAPRWSYVPRPHDELRRALDDAENALSHQVATRKGGDDDRSAALAWIYRARVRELITEAQLCGAAGSSLVGRLARQRFAPDDPTVARAASDLCCAWLERRSSTAPTGRGCVIASDSCDPRSLISRMRAAVGRLRLPFSVVAAPTLAPLAATGDHVIFVATGRSLSDEDAVRTVLHEIEGHARPRARSRRATCALFRAGTARGADDQEGRALLIEERAGLLGLRRRRHLAARHRAVEAMFDGASFADVARMLVDLHELDETEAIVVAERAFRGGDGTHPGLGRERVYLESFVRVQQHLENRPDDEDVLAAGQVSVDAAEALRPLAPDVLGSDRGARGQSLPSM
ncbi:MAG TPA: tyrosine/phenylalanine carboxypeptidase domain-containing protein [Polyangiaceae bacterium]|nr:tyrosine/phenylalanine carboxypeptidase domain-containing protein [Polyangiaceae bacterium]